MATKHTLEFAENNTHNKKSKIAILTMDQCKTFSTEKTITLLKEHVPLIDEDIKNIKQGFRGQHLYSAIKAFETTQLDTQSKSDATKSMIEYLSKHIQGDTSEFIANWLIDTFFRPPTNKNSTTLPQEFHESPFEWFEGIFQVDLKKCFESLLDKPFYPTEGTVKGFYNREGFVHSVQSLVKDDLHHFHLNKVSAVARKDSFIYGMISNGTGNGKTRACREIQNICLNMEFTNPTYKHRKLHSYFSLDSGSSLTSVEIDYGPFKQATEGKLIGLRLLSRIIGQSASYVVETLGDYFEYIYITTTFFTLQNIMKKFETFIAENEILIWTIAIDEVQNLFQTFGNILPPKGSTLTPWKQPLYAIGNYMLSTEGPNTNLKNICLIPVLSGLKHISELKFEPTEYSSKLFVLPPLVPSNLNAILQEHFKNSTFKCGKPLINLTKVKNPNITQSIGITLFEALIIPQVLNITLNTIITFLTQINFKDWEDQSEELFAKMKKQINQHVKAYLPKHEDVLLGHTFKKSFLPRLLSGLDVTLSETEKNLFGEGKIYKTPTGSLYIAPHYFLKMLQDDPFISNKLSKHNTKLNPRNFEKIDLKCICYRIACYKMEISNSETITIKYLFPSTSLNDQTTFKLPKQDFKIVSQESFITKDIANKCIKIDISKCRKNDGEIYSYTSETHPCVDAHFWLNDYQDKPSIFLLQYKNYSLTTHLSVVKWLDKNRFTDIALEEFKNFNVYFVMITTTKISAEEFEKLKNHQHHDKVIVISHQDSKSEKYFPPNLVLPYYKGFLFGSSKNCCNIPLSNEYSQEQRFNQDQIHEFKELGEILANLASQ